MNRLFVAFFFILCHSSSFAAVILQYHHVSDVTPTSTSITPKQFAVHLQYLKDNEFNVLPLSELINAIKNKKPLPDKAVAITFDDAYRNLFEEAKPLLDKFGYPYTIYVNPAIIERNENNLFSDFLSWTQLKSMADGGAIIANHGYEHNSLIRIPDNLSKKQWLTKQGKLLLKAEKIIKEKTGKSWRYFAYPYGEYDTEIQSWLKDHKFIGFSQQSGAVGPNTDLTSVPRFPASMPYDQISTLADKIHSLPFSIHLKGAQAKTTFKHKESKNVTFTIEHDDFNQEGLSCYITGQGKQKVVWHGDRSFTLHYTKDLPVGRVRANCTAASLSQPNRFYWYSKPWFILNDDGSWYPL